MSRPPLLRFLSSLTGERRVLEPIVPRRTFDDVILPPATRRALDQALAQVANHDLIFRSWGLGERHRDGRAIAFNFAGPSGTGKTICAEAIAHALRRRLLVVRYDELESMWMGETAKNVVSVFRLALESNAVLFFDEADAIASRRGSAPGRAIDRESNTVVNVLLQELERFSGVVIFATNLASNFDPAFERRLRTHVLFERPGAGERERIWRVQMHPDLTPLAADVDFRALAERYDATGGEIRNAVLKAALAAASEPAGRDGRVIRQHHLEQGIRDVLDSKRVMRQSLLDPTGESTPAHALETLQALHRRLVVTATLAVVAVVIAMLALILVLVRDATPA